MTKYKQKEAKMAITELIQNKQFSSSMLVEIIDL